MGFIFVHGYASVNMHDVIIFDMALCFNAIPKNVVCVCVCVCVRVQTVHVSNFSQDKYSLHKVKLYGAFMSIDEYLCQTEPRHTLL